MNFLLSQTLPNWLISSTNNPDLLKGIPSAKDIDSDFVALNKVPTPKASAGHSQCTRHIVIARAQDRTKNPLKCNLLRPTIAGLSLAETNSTMADQQTLDSLKPLDRISLFRQINAFLNVSDDLTLADFDENFRRFHKSLFY